MIPFTHVQHTAERVAIVGSGPSLAGVTLAFPASVQVIAVNGGIDLVRPTFWFTAHPSEENRDRMASQLSGVTYYAAVGTSFANPRAQHAYERRPPEPNVLYLVRVPGPGARSSKRCLSEDPTKIHGGNSGYGALGLAYLMRPRKVALFGIDGHGGYAVGTGQPAGPLNHLPWLFSTACPQLEARGVQVVVGSPVSRLRVWPRMDPLEAVAWLAS